MKGRILLLCASLFIISSFTKKEDKIANLKTFAKAYGYVKYFHPSDESSKIDWNNFAAYGVEAIIKCNSQAEVITTLNDLFRPIAPSVVFSKTKQDYDFKGITPEIIEGYQPTYWQHKGVSLYMSNQNSPYRSVRVNRYSEIDESSSFGNLTMSIDAEKYKGREIKYTGWVKLKPGSKGTGHLWLRVDKADKKLGFFDNMMANPIKDTEWMPYEIIGEVDDLATDLSIGSFIYGKGTLYLDDVKLFYKEQNEWIEIPVKNSGFEAEQIGVKNEETQWLGKSDGYAYQVSNTEKKAGNRCAVIAYEGKIKKVQGDSIFESFPKFGELIESEIGKGIYCQIPLNLYANEESTYPKSTTFSTLQGHLNTTDQNPSVLSMRLANVINTYNVFQHFYPYFEEAGTNWEKELEIALHRSYSDQTANDHLITLEKFTAP